MHQVYGTLAWPAIEDDGPAALTRMLATAAGVPGAESAAVALPVHAGSGALAVLAAGEVGYTPPRPLGWAGLTIVADVRLDNRQALWEQLQIDHQAGKTLADPLLLIHAYQRWETGMLSRLLGDFAFALWDSARQRLFCGRDVAGVRPFYYQQRPGQGFAWASDLAALLAHPRTSPRLNLAYVKAQLLEPIGEFHHPGQTYYAAIEKLPPAHGLVVEQTGLRTWAYWQPGQLPERRYRQEADYAEEVRALLTTAVACRVQGTVHGVGAHLSGGLDSSSVAVVAHRVLQAAGRGATAFSWAPPPDLVPPTKGRRADDERPLVEAVAAFASAESPLPLRYTTLQPAHALAYAGRDLTTQPTTTLQLELATSADAAALGIRTMLSGWGGDELLVFNGRGYFADLFRRGRWVTLQREFHCQSQIHGGATWKKWLTEGLLPLLPDALLHRLRPADAPPPPRLPQGLRPEFAAALAAVEPLTRPPADGLVGVRRTQIALLNHGHLPYRMEAWAAHGATLGLTYAFPLLDRRIIEFALSIPADCFFKNGWKRHLYRTAMQGILPDEVRWHKVKEDPAMVEQMRRVQKIVRPAMHEQLRTRCANRFIDVEVVLQAEAALGEPPDFNAVDPRELWQQLLARRVALGGQWLAFVNPKATY